MPPAGAVTLIVRLRLVAEGFATATGAIAIATPSRRSVGRPSSPGSIVSRLSAMSAIVSVTPESPNSNFDPLVMLVSLMFTVWRAAAGIAAGLAVSAGWLKTA